MAEIRGRSDMEVKVQASGKKVLVRAESLHKSYVMKKKMLHILKGAVLEVREGEHVAIVGMSGVGKSTLLHILGGLDRPDEGRVFIGEENIYTIPENKRARMRGTRVGFIFQSYNLLPEMDVVENVMLPAMSEGEIWKSWKGLRDRALELLDAVGLAGRADHTPHELSGGEQQRVAIARALMNGPQIILADEPTGNLDDVTGKSILDLLFKLAGREGHSLIMVTHNEKVAGNCDRVLRLRDGVLDPVL